jgi:hypothetical protein
MSWERNVTYVSGPDTGVLARPEGVEPPTPRFEVWCSIQLSYGRFGSNIADGVPRGSSVPRLGAAEWRAFQDESLRNPIFGSGD